ncbi:L-fucose/L-arabinose isomerase family protein [Micromonospora sp. 4G57]|uniref:L-fucose/L-arabinose isomerase family protein n=1 Tax=Micromonospora sicca TaxID=2202420 RepID=A0ABU5JBG4_9ACTN|nr:MULTISPECIES: L-fucose/L-arabinose isomerase family protein [unclassified Micromonospora]MDZ5441545.1 L-fucose/L-arabinose isomerase family protein [Micromonospora sp. 4G57]MDZ5489942.1 L-fucose/L-arabinose isomerase family protein [Micromonospora sp. 4G53]
MTTTTEPVAASPTLARLPHRRVKVGLVAGGLGAYWPQFPDLLPQLQRSAARVSEKMHALGADVVDVGFISDAQEGAAAAEKLRVAGCDIIVGFLTTYMTATMLLPIAQRSDAPVLLINLQPTEAMDHASFDTGQWLAYCGACPLPEMANTFTRCGIPFRSVSGYLEDERAWARIARWVKAAGVRAALRRGRHGLMGHLYPGMLDVSTDLTMVPANFGGHMEVVEFDDLRIRVNTATEEQVRAKMEQAREIFEVTDSVVDEDFQWAARVSVGLDRLVEDFELDSLAYYHRGLEGEQHERLGAGMILGASLLTARGIPAAGEYELRTSLAMLIMDRLGAGGSFTELQALNFFDNVVEMGHDGPAHLAISDGKPLLRGLGVYHGKRGWGVSVEFDVKHGPVTAFGVGQTRDGRYAFLASEGAVVAGPRLQIGNTTSRVDFGCDPGEWTDAWSASGVGHHWALGTGHQVAELRAVAELLDVEFRELRV